MIIKGQDGELNGLTNLYLYLAYHAALGNQVPPVFYVSLLHMRARKPIFHSFMKDI